MITDKPELGVVEPPLINISDKDCWLYKFDVQRLHTINVLPDFPHKSVKWKLKTQNQILFVNSIMQSRIKKQGFSFEFGYI